MTNIERIQNTPVIRLTPAEIALLPDEDRSHAFNILFDMAREGSLAMVTNNPAGTTYEVVWDKALGWKLSPICCCKNEQRFIEAYDDYHGEK